ncbi:MAG TPA: ATP-binding protein [Chthonomonadaceae bacterium]|nr:ATP-binding protein [Chthonomonadaceae bacterium]
MRLEDADNRELPEAPDDIAQRFPEEAVVQIREDISRLGGPYVPPADREGSVGVTMFDTPTSDDDTIPILLPRQNIGLLPSQAAVRIKSADGRVYLGVVVRGPFALPDGLRADAPPIVATAIRGGVFLPEYHGLVIVEIAGEERNGSLQPHRFRPLPNSPVWVLSDEEVQDFLRTGGNVRLGMAYGHDNLEIAFPANDKSVLPRHTGILGTTGGGKSTTVANLICQLQAAGVAVILLDTEGEYTVINEPTDDPKMMQALAERGRQPQGVEDTHLYYLVGRQSANPFHPKRLPFSPAFSNISPYAALEIFDLNEAQEERFQKAISVTVRALDELKIWTEADLKFVKEEMDEFDAGYPKMRLSHLYDVTRTVADLLQHGARSPYPVLLSPEFRSKEAEFDRLLKEATKDESKRWDSWRKVQGKLGRIERLNLFDNRNAPPLDYKKLLAPGQVSIIDLSDTDSTLVNNLIISDLLRGVQKAQEEAYQQATTLGRDPTPVVLIIEEAHEFLSAQRIGKMPILHQQVERIAKRGRKRWLGLAFVTQLPQHLPDAILGLVNNFILHKIGDANVISRLKRSIGSVDESLWTRLPRLAPGQAVVSVASLARPMLTAMDPAPCQLKMVR